MLGLSGYSRIGIWLASFHPIREDGAVVGVLIFIVEITEQRRAQEALQASERLFRTLTSQAPVGIFLTDARGRCQFVNERWQEVAGMSPEDALGEGWLRAIHPEDRAWVLREWERATAAGEEFCAEYRFQRPDGKVTWLQGRDMQLRQGQEVQGYLGTVTDITARREADELRRQMPAVVTNLVSNAVQYGAPPIRVRAQGRPGEVVLEVHDAGGGIPAQELASLFEPFRRGAAQGKDQREGLGLGLYISREIVSAHGGTIEAQSAKEAGTTFTVRLPRSPPDR